MCVRDRLWRGGNFLYLRDATCLGAVARTFCVMAVYLLLILCTWLCYAESFWTALFAASSGYIAQDIAGSLKIIVRLIPAVSELAGHSLGILAVDLFCYGCLLYTSLGVQAEKLSMSLLKS